MNELVFIGEPKVSKRRGWVFFAMVNTLLLAGCLWTVSNYNDWHGDDHLRSGAVVTVAERVWTRIICALILVVVFGTVFIPLHRWISWTRWIVGVLMVLGLIAGLFDGTSYSFGISAMLALAFIVALIASVYLPATRHWSFALAMVAIFSGTVLANHVSLPRHQRLIEARNAFSFADISSRLNYELWGSMDAAEFPTDRDERVIAEFERMEPPQPGNSERDKQVARRNSWLERFHDVEYEKFIRAEGFGVSRIVYPWAGRAELPTLRDITTDETFDISESSTEEFPYKHDSFEQDQAGIVASETIDTFHERSLDDFLNPLAFGYIQSRQIVAGFQPHAFHLPVTPKYRPSKQPKLTELQLVSLLRFREPLVYEVDNLPRMDQLSSDDIETRALDNFEHLALMRLQNGEEIVVDSSGPTIRMLGAIRARYECLQCHTVEDESLLGAFSYRFSVPSTQSKDGK